MGNILVSVIMPTYNHEAYISRALESILNQDRDFDLEILIGDDCSTDGTREICEQYKSKFPHIIKLIYNSQNLGLLGNYKNLFNNARGKYIAILESDDFWCCNSKLSKQVEFLELNNEYGVVYTNANFLYQDSFILKKNVQTNKPSGDIFHKLIKGNFIIAGSVCFRKSLFDKFINIDEYIESKFKTLDYPLWLEFSLRTKFKYLNYPTITYRIVSKSISNNSDQSKAFEFINSSKEIVEFIIRKYSLNKNLNRFIYNNCLIQQIKYLCKKDRIKEAQEIANNITVFNARSFVSKHILRSMFLLTILSKRYFK